MKNVLCTYCGAPAATRDHIPPKNLYIGKQHSITVPACRACHDKFAKDDELFMVVHALTAKDPPQEVVDRAFRCIEHHSPGMRTRLFAATRRYNVRTPHGIHIGEAYGLDLLPEDIERIRGVVLRIATGMHYKLIGERTDDDSECEVQFLSRDIFKSPSMQKMFKKAQAQIVTDKNVCVLVGYKVEGSRKDSAWFFEFYQTHLYHVRIFTKELSTALEERRAAREAA